MEQHRTEDPEPRLQRHLPVWIQVVVWGGLFSLLILVGVGLVRARQGTVQPGYEVPDFTLQFFGGYEYNGLPEVKLSDLRGKVVFINFWASWCKPCEDEALILEEGWSHYRPGGQVVFLGVDYVDTEPAARAFLERFGNTYPNGPDLGTAISQMFRIQGVPETFVIDPEGVLRFVKIGPFESVAELKAAVDPYLP
jgi:cytochrome c biogenesis protein CcmG/thiol:disulfide interchange protein DsbE